MVSVRPAVIMAEEGKCPIMETIMPLSHMQEGSRAVVDAVFLTHAMGRRVRELGFFPGTEVQCLRRAPAGSPIVFGVLDAAIALRETDAKHIRVRLWD